MTRKRVFIAGHNGMVGSAICRLLNKDKQVELVLKTRSELDLSNQAAVNQFFANQAIDEVYLAAARVGGIQANNSYPADFLYENLMIEANIIHAAYKNSISKLLFLGSSCIYPKLADQPMKEEELLNGYLEPTNEAYAIAKISGIRLCEAYKRQHGCDFRSVMPTNLYGPGDNYHPENSHVIPGLIQRFHKAKLNNDPEISCWGSGSPLREFLHVDDLADACLHVMQLPSPEINDHNGHINVGSGSEITIKELAELIKDITEYQGEIVWDSSKPDGTPRKLLDSSRLNKLGWSASIELKDGLNAVYNNWSS